jgi:hypothetical protein
MSLRLKVHPKTGALLEPLYVSATSGRKFWPILGASPDDPSNGSDSSGGGEGSEGGSGKDGAGSEGQGSDTGDQKDGEDKAVPGSEYLALKNRMQAADRRATAAEQKIKEFEDKDKGELEKATEKAKTLEQSVNDLNAENATLRLQVAFLSTNEHAWHNSETALAEAERNGYLEGAVREDRSIDRAVLKTALKKLATERPFLVNTATGNGEGDGSTTGSNVGRGS